MKFKIGDTVKFIGGGWEDYTGTITEVGSEAETFPYRAKRSDGLNGILREDEMEPITAEPQMGDRVRVTSPGSSFHNQEGEVTAIREVEYRFGVSMDGDNAAWGPTYFGAHELMVVWAAPDEPCDCAEGEDTPVEKELAAIWDFIEKAVEWQGQENARAAEATFQTAERLDAIEAALLQLLS